MLSFYMVWCTLVTPLSCQCTFSTLDLCIIAAIPSTSRPRQWGKGTAKRDPGPCVRPEYYTTWNVTRRKEFDVRPTALQRSTLSDQEVFDFVKNIQEGHSNTPSAWELMLPITYEDGPVFQDPAHQIEVMEQCEKFYCELEESICTDPYLMPGTEGQANSDKWLKIRPFLFTASEAKKICGLSTGCGKKNFLRQHLWEICGK